MKICVAHARDLLAGGRIDARYVVDGVAAMRERLSTVASNRLISSMGIAAMPARIKKVEATAAEKAVPYLRPYDVFEYLPPQSDAISWDRTPSIETYTICEGDILQTRSGRNLGPVTLADEYLARFALSDDMVRVRIEDESDRLYTFAFLRSNVGQHSLRGDRGGSVISHISRHQVGALGVPFVDAIVQNVVDKARSAVRLREEARLSLHAAIESLNDAYPAASTPLRDGWTVGSAQLQDRFDPAFHAEPTATDRETLTEAGGIRLGDVADVVKPGGRHKMVYVEAGHGEPFLSGRQILQCDVVAAKHLARQSAQAAGGFALSEHSVIFQSDGRAEEGLGYPAYVTAERDGWLASGHVARAVPHSAADAGWIWASMASDAVRSQVVALSCGSVVDALYPKDVEEVILPPRDAVDSMAVSEAWRQMAEGSKLLADAAAIIDEALGTEED